MPIMRCHKNGKLGYKWGKSGFCYVGAGAKAKAEKQMKAIFAAGYRDAAEDIIQNKIMRRRELMGNIKKTFRKRPPKQLHPTSIERQYYQRLLELINVIQKQTEQIIIPHLESLVSEYNSTLAKYDSLFTDGWAENADRLVNTLQMNITANNPIPNPELMAMEIGQYTSDWNDKEWRKIMRGVMGVEYYQREPWMNDLLQSFSRENAALIKSIPQQYISDLEGTVQRGIKGGFRHETIAKEIRRKYEIVKIEPTKAAKSGFRAVNLRKRSALIARDQVSKLNSQITKNRQEGLGIQKYIWRTSLDERVRPSHMEKEGETFSWNNPPADTGHPGEDINCRCTAEPVFTEELLSV